MDSAAPPPGAPAAAPSFEERFAALARDWRGHLPGRLADLRVRAAACRHDPQDSGGLEEFYRQAHMLAGSAGTFGLAVVGERARELEAVLLRLMDMPSRADTDFESVQEGLDALLAAAPRD